MKTFSVDWSGKERRIFYVQRTELTGENYDEIARAIDASRCSGDNDDDDGGGGGGGSGGDAVTYDRRRCSRRSCRDNDRIARHTASSDRDILRPRYSEISEFSEALNTLSSYRQSTPAIDISAWHTSTKYRHTRVVMSCRPVVMAVVFDISLSTLILGDGKFWDYCTVLYPSPIRTEFDMRE